MFMAKKKKSVGRRNADITVAWAMSRIIPKLLNIKEVREVAGVLENILERTHYGDQNYTLEDIKDSYSAAQRLFDEETIFRYVK